MTQIKTDFIFLICVIRLYLRLKIQLQSKLNITSWTSRRNRAKTRRRDHRTGRPKISPVESIEHVRLKSQIEAFRNLELLAHREIPRLQVWTLNDADSAVSATSRGSGGERRRINPAIWSRTW